MKVWGVLADVGRPIPPGSAVNLLNAGWTFTTAMPVDDGTFTLPEQALAVFVEADWDELNRPHPLSIELVDDEGTVASLHRSNGEVGDMRIEQDIIIPPVPQAPNGVPGLATVLLNISAGALRIPEPRRRYIWRMRVGSVTSELGFWVAAAPQAPVIGGMPNP